MNASGDGEIRFIELEDADISELVAVGIEKLVVVNVVVLAEDPLAIGTQIGLGGLAFNLIVQRLLAFVGMRKIELVGEKQCSCQHRRGDENRQDDAINAGPGGFDGGDFVGALHQAEGDQDRQQHHQRHNVVQQIGSDIQQVFGHHEGRNFIAQDVAQKFEEREHQNQDEKRGENHPQVDEEIAQHVIVDQGGEAGAEHAAAGGGALEGILGAAAEGGGQQSILVLPRAAEGCQLEGPFFSAEQQQQGQGEKDEIGEPGSEPG